MKNGENISMDKGKNLEGMRFNFLKVICLFSKTPRKWVCECDCGRFGAFIQSNIERGSTKSCGCFRKSKNKEINTSHKMSKTREYRTWSSIMGRCYNKNVNGYESYGRRGIKVCDEWLNSFEKFYEDMGSKPIGYSIERIDVNGDYCKENCCWIPFAEQWKNKRKIPTIINYNGIEKSVSYWAKLINLTKDSLEKRLNNGEKIEDIIFEREVEKEKEEKELREKVKQAMELFDNEEDIINYVLRN